MLWTESWIWLAAAFGLAILEVVAPGFIFLGFAIGAAAVGAIIGLTGLLTTSFPVTFVVFALVSLVAWIVLRRVIGVQKNQVQTFSDDINDTPRSTSHVDTSSGDFGGGDGGGGGD